MIPARIGPKTVPKVPMELMIPFARGISSSLQIMGIADWTTGVSKAETIPMITVKIPIAVTGFSKRVTRNRPIDKTRYRQSISNIKFLFGKRSASTPQKGRQINRPTIDNDAITLKVNADFVISSTYNEITNWTIVVPKTENNWLPINKLKFLFLFIITILLSSLLCDKLKNN